MLISTRLFRTGESNYPFDKAAWSWTCEGSVIFSSLGSLVYLNVNNDKMCFKKKIENFPRSSRRKLPLLLPLSLLPQGPSSWWSSSLAESESSLLLLLLLLRLLRLPQLPAAIASPSSALLPISAHFWSCFLDLPALLLSPALRPFPALVGPRW